MGAHPPKVSRGPDQSHHCQVNVRSHASSVLHDKLIVFGGVRDKACGRMSRTGSAGIKGDRISG